MTSPDQNEPTVMETYLEALQHNRGAEGAGHAAQLGFMVQFTPTFGYVGDVESAERARGEYERLTGTRFSTYRQSKDFGKKDFGIEHHKICWEDCSKLRQGHVAFDHVPYIVIGMKMLDCQHGRDRHLAKKRRSLEAINAEPPDWGQGSKQKRKKIIGKKMDCPAQIYYRDILKFPEYAISANSVWRRKTMSEKLRKELSSDSTVTSERRIYVKFPEDGEHRGHQSENVEHLTTATSLVTCDKEESLVSKAIRTTAENREPSDHDSKKGRNPLKRTQEVHATRSKGHPTTPGEMPLPYNHVEHPSEAHAGKGNGSKTIGLEPPEPHVAANSRPELATRDGALHEGMSTVVDSSSRSLSMPERVASQEDGSLVKSSLNKIRGMTEAPLPDGVERVDSASSTEKCQEAPREDPNTEASSLQPDKLSILNRAATRCRRVLQQLMRDTYVVKDIVVLDRALEQLKEVQEILKSGRQRDEDVSMARTKCSMEGEMKEKRESIHSVLAEEICNMQTKSDEKRGQKRAAGEAGETTDQSTTSPRSKHRKRKVPKVIREEVIHVGDGPLSNVTIQHVQRLMLAQFPQIKGFEDPLLGHQNGFSAAQGDFGQLLLDGKQHWVFVSSIGTKSGRVRYFDSLGNPKVPGRLLMQIASIMCSQDREITVDVQSVQKSESITDSGLFAIAFAVSVLNSQDPSEISYDLVAMRKHLYRCLKENEIRPFPTMEVEIMRTDRRFLSVEVFCVCRMPWNTSSRDSTVKMAHCKSCGEWYHSNCCGIPAVVFDGSGQSWKCPRCEDIQSVVLALNSLEASVIHEQPGSSSTSSQD